MLLKVKFVSLLRKNVVCFPTCSQWQWSCSLHREQSFQLSTPFFLLQLSHRSFCWQTQTRWMQALVSKSWGYGEKLIIKPQLNCPNSMFIWSWFDFFIVCLKSGNTAPQQNMKENSHIKTNTTPPNYVCNFFCSVSLMKAIARCFCLAIFLKIIRHFLTPLLCGGLLQLPDLTLFIHLLLRFF